MKRVVITGMGAVSPLGIGLEALMEGLEQNRSGISRLEELEGIGGLQPRLGGRVLGCEGLDIERKFRRFMSPLSIFAVVAAREALAQARIDQTRLRSNRTGICLGSTLGSANTLQAFFTQFLKDMSIEGIRSTEFFKIMSHTCAANLAQYFGISGRVLAPSAACCTGCQAVGLAAEFIAHGKQDIMLCGGADELHPLTVATFDILQAASTNQNDTPDQTPRPFDATRDGIVCAEGAGVLVLESLDSALERGATIFGEILGFASTSDPSNPASPSPEAITECMHEALRDAGLSPKDVEYINAHATGTIVGDAAECLAIEVVFGSAPLVSSLKGHMGHTMAASGALEIAATLEMMRKGLIIPTRNLQDITPECQIQLPLTIIRRNVNISMKNNFGLGGINTSIILRGNNDGY
jgi:3-oxoacyl-[acyl-carrier-protein] synthase II